MIVNDNKSSRWKNEDQWTWLINGSPYPGDKGYNMIKLDNYTVKKFKCKNDDCLVKCEYDH